MLDTLFHYLAANPLEAFGTFLGFVYLWLEWRASIWLWLAGVLMPAVYVVVFYQAGLYADVGMQLYYIAVSIYGFALWRMKTERAAERPISRMNPRLWLPLLAVSGLLWLGCAWLLQQTDSNVVWADAFTTALSMAAMWMLAKKYAEQWLMWVVVDVASAALYLYKGLHFTAFLYAFYSVIAFFGYFKWLKLMEKQT